MPGPRTPYLAAFRGARAPVKSTRPKAVPSPVGATNSTSAGDQAKALRAGASEESYLKKHRRYGKL